MQAGATVLESRRAVSGGATATRAASAGGDALPRRAPCTPDTHQRKHTATGGRMGALPCYAPSMPMHAHTALTARHSRIRLCIQERCCLGTVTDAHDCVHTSPCILWRPHTWHAGTRAPTATPTPAAPTLLLAATSAPCCNSVCTTAACPEEEATCKLVPGATAAATLSCAGHPALRTRTSPSTLQQGVAWAPSRAMQPPRQCMRTRP